jgi:hypothetical protein
MAAQEIHYASMAQVVEVSPQASSLTRDTKKLRSIVVISCAGSPIGMDGKLPLSASRWSQTVTEPYQGFSARGH